MESKAVLLGNGFSRAFSDSIFSYDSLYAEAQFRGDVEKIFEKMNTTDFEAVMRRLDEASEVNRLYGFTQQSYTIEPDVKLIRESLITVLRQCHPSSRNELTEQQATSCYGFLSEFNSIFTLNYDLLMYWAYVRFCESSDSQFKDGFGAENGKLYWQRNRKDQTVYYLHGALHLYADGHKLQKIRYRNNDGDMNIIDQIADRIKEKQYPLFVSEGDS